MWDALLAWYGPQTTGIKSDISGRLSSFKMAPGSDPLKEMDRIEGLAAEMHTAGVTLDHHMLYTIFIDTLPAEYEAEAKNLASRDSIGRHDIIKAARERHHRFSGSDQMLAMPALLCLPAVAMVATEKGPAAVPTGKVEAAKK